MKRMLGFSVFALALVGVFGVGPAFAGELAAPAAPPAVATVSPGCTPALDLAAVLSGQGELCPATAPDSATPEFMARPPRLRTCVCSCGYPCTTDADCGPGGTCGPGITCC
ncbi:MAG TPA: hypothetical protein VGG03_01230 [Thermoanaerobaculia bacterium]|jgi:hypothetical protein